MLILILPGTYELLKMSLAVSLYILISLVGIQDIKLQLLKQTQLCGGPALIFSHFESIIPLSVQENLLDVVPVLP